MSLPIFACSAGTVALPDKTLVLVSRADGGNLIVSPARSVWDRSELSPVELTLWSFLVAAAGKAMINVLPQLQQGCVNYWDAGNWALNDEAEPRGERKAGPAHRRLHLHLLGRSRDATAKPWRWGEAPFWPEYKDRFGWAAAFDRLTPIETKALVHEMRRLLLETYGVQARHIQPWLECVSCGYPVPGEDSSSNQCAECRF
jgi:hypothetical protein